MQSLADILRGKRDSLKEPSEEALRFLSNESLAPLDQVRPNKSRGQRNPHEVDISRDSFNAHGLGIMASVPSEIWRPPENSDADDKAALEIIDEILGFLTSSSQ
jgi:hypothetical protein